MEATWDTGLDLDLEAGARRRLRRAYAFSALGHVLLVLVLMLRPSPEPMVLPPAITVDLVAAPQTPAPAEAAKPAPAPKPRPVAPPPPPQPKILPKRAPDALAKPAPKPAPEPIRRRARPKEMELGDAMAALRSELGEEVPPPVTDSAPAETTELAAATPGPAAGAGTAAISPELRAWIVATTRHVQSRWVNPPEFLGRGLLTELRVELQADGTVVGEPEVLRSSGDPYADDNAVRALQKSSPLPPPPKAGPQVFIFSPEASRL